MASARAGVVVGDAEGGLWFGDDDGLRKLHTSQGPIAAVLQTEAGTILAFAGDPSSAGEAQTLLRSSDGGASFTETPTELWIKTLAQFPGGPIVAGGEGDDRGVIASLTMTASPSPR